MAKARIWKDGQGWVSLDAAVAENALKLGDHLPDYYAKQTDMTGAQNDILALQKSYDAYKVLTDIAGGSADGKLEDGSTGKVYQVNELLKALKTTLDGLTGGTGGESIDERIATAKADLQDKIDAVTDAPIRDRVKILGKLKADGSVVIDFSAVDTHLDKSIAYPVYKLDNVPLLDAAGNNVMFNFATGLVSGLPTKIVDNADTPDDLHDVKRVPLGVDVDFKVFPIGQFTFKELEANEDFLLDNEELNTAVYADAIDKLAVQLSQDSSLIDHVKALVGTEAVQNQIAAVTDALNTRLTAAENAIVKLNGDETVEGSVAKAVKTAKDAVQANLDTEVTRAKAAEQANADAISAEVTRATGAEGVLRTDLAAEVTRAKDAEIALGNRATALEGRDKLIISAAEPADHAALWVDLSV